MPLEHVSSKQRRKARTGFNSAMRPNTIEALHNTAQHFLYRIALVWHCHQRQDRSFFIRHRQLPLCARCTGILVGCLAAPAYFAHLRWTLALLLIAVFVADSLTQLCGLRYSNNVLRFITGMGFSIAVLGLTVGAARWLWSITL